MSAGSVRIRLNRLDDLSHEVFFAPLDEVGSLLAVHAAGADDCVVVTDANVVMHHGQALDEALESAGFSVRRIVIEPGETSKSFDTYGRLLDSVLTDPIDRKTPIVAFGGGVVGDLAGFAAATLLRGLPLIQIPTTLVAQVDSAIGGKTGINHATGKNLIGAFHQPRFVLVDTNLLETLPDREWVDGLSEVVKYGLIADRDLTRLLRDSWTDILNRQRGVVDSVVRRCVEIKAGVVSEDETERGLRAILNFGHTFGHALEKVAGYKGLTHGQGVALGMRAALHLSAIRFPDSDFSEAEDLVERLPAASVEASIDELFDAMKSDKKRLGNRLRFVLLRELGQAVVVDGVDDHDVRASWQSALSAASVHPQQP